MSRCGEVDLRVIPAGFLGLILMGTLLLKLPWAHREGHGLGWLDSLFLSTSSVCVTGLSTVNVAETFSGFGQVILLFLIQAGGLGIFTASLLLVLVSGKRLSLADEQTIHTTMGRLREARPLDVFIYGCVFVGVLELAGTVAMFPLIAEAWPDQEVGESLWQAVFHSVSGFCNAGISIFPDGLMHWRDHPALLAVVEVMAVLGGIGLMTLINLRFWAPWRRDRLRRGRLTLQTRMALTGTVFLLMGGAVATWAFEQTHTLEGGRWWQSVSWAFFHSVSTRTVGFNVVEVGEMNGPTILVTMVMMFIGGSPGSMAGGIKTVTLVVLVMTAWAALRRREEIQCFGRRVDRKLSGVAMMVTMLGAGCVVLGVGLLMVVEDGQPATETAHPWIGLIFEAVSAFGTVGLSMGVTPLLSGWGKVVIIVLMFVGRVGPLLLSVYLSRAPRKQHVLYPTEEVAIG